MKKIIIIGVICAFVPFTGITAEETLTSPELEQVTGQSGIDLDELRSMSFEEIREQWSREDFRQLSAEERTEARQIMDEKIASLSPEERQQMMQARQEHFQSMSPEERQQMMQTARERFQSMSPDEQQQIMQKVREMRASGQGPGMMSGMMMGRGGFPR